jgi:hypothetical protein
MFAHWSLSGVNRKSYPDWDYYGTLIENKH